MSLFSADRHTEIIPLRFFFHLYSSTKVGCSLLPHIIGVKKCVGMATVSCYGITKNVTKVYGGLGDMQCAIFSCNPSPNEAGIIRIIYVSYQKNSDIGHIKL